MHALRFDHFGDPDVLDLEDMPDASAAGGEAVIAVKSSSVNPSDLKNVAGQFRQTTLPRIPGRDFAGIVVDGPGDWIGAEVWGTGGDIGFTRDGVSGAPSPRSPTPSAARSSGRIGSTPPRVRQRRRSSRISSRSKAAGRMSAPRSSDSLAERALMWCSMPSAASPRRRRWPR
jgi:hypothetical protein